MSIQIQIGKANKKSLRTANLVTLELEIPSNELKLTSDSNWVNVIIHNESDSTIQFYENWNSYGFYNFHFEILTNDSLYKITRPFRLWWRNFPSSFEIEPHSNYQLSFNLVDSLRKNFCGCKSFWKGLPINEYKKAKLRVLYNLPKKDWDNQWFTNRRNYKDLYYRDTTEFLDSFFLGDTNLVHSVNAEPDWIYHTDLSSDFIPIKILK